MESMRKSILVLQSDLNRQLISGKPGLFNNKAVYSLSLKLDKEIVKYYKKVMNH
ncbi:hypothetical protein [Sporanaerobium hydrogeniformans]|uniref:hypothetical protein n=1 Tax=Sporanaerobium hydrogeniformans TaxID=3072179 RepID=UPI0015D4E765|nr:hypothetical protein [Sporanaerobium hydrogeniformans]